MEWLEANYERYRKFSDDQHTVRAVADEIYAELWRAIGEVVTAGNQRRMNLGVNGFPGRHTVSMGGRVLRICLSEDKQSITAHDPEGGLTVIKLMLDSRNSVFLENRGDVVSYAESAKRIMEPFLFSGSSPYAVPGPSDKD